MKQLLFIAILLSSFAVNAARFSFTGNLSDPDAVQLFRFSMGENSIVNMRTWSYSGGTNTAGKVISAGGFDTQLALFKGNPDSDGYHEFIDSYYDDINNGPALDVRNYDSLVDWELEAGDYILALTQNFNDPIGDLEDGFYGKLLNFNDSDSNGVVRSSFWALDITGEDLYDASPVPVPAALWLFGSAFMGLFGMRKKSQIATA
jgi:hypothetical protein